MSRIERYVLRTATLASLSGVIVLTGVVWVTQALRQIDLLTSKGQTILIFFGMTGLAVPSLLAIIAPVALFAGILYCLNRLNGDSELVVMAAAGISPARLLRPFAVLSAAVFAIVAMLYLQVMPWSFNAIGRLTTYIHADFIANFARPGAFTELEAGFVFHYRERTADGALRGVFMQDRRDRAHITTYIAEAGKTIEKGDASYLVLSKGVLLRPQSAGDSAVVSFADYTIDLSQFIKAADSIRKPRERSTLELMFPDPKDSSVEALGGRLRGELMDRLASPLYAFVGALFAFAALGEARTTRQGRGAATSAAILAFVVVRMLGIAAVNLSVTSVAGAVLVWAVPILSCVGALVFVFRRPLLAVGGGSRLGPSAAMGPA